MKDVRTLDSSSLKQTMVVFHRLLMDHREHLNRLNVYPVPDADTGTNLAMTMQSVVDALSLTTDMGEVCSAIKRGSLLGARGASGVIVSQLLGALADRLAGSPVVAAPDLGSALEAASAAADKAVLRPVEGTILTVVRETARAATAAAEADLTVAAVVEMSRQAAGEALSRTPDQLPALRRAGVVDAGASGFVLLLDAVLYVLTGRPLPDPPSSHRPVMVGRADHATPRFEVVVRLEVDAGVLDEFRAVWEGLGNESTVVVEGEGWWLAHIHTDHPEAAMEAARAAGAVQDVQVTDLIAQVSELKARGSIDGATAVVAIAGGEGIQDLFRDHGAAVVVAGGPARNPSVAELLDAIEGCGQTQVIILPNDGNTVPVARQAVGLTERTVIVVPTETMPEGLAAIRELDLAADADVNAKKMAEAAARVVSGSVSQAVRAADTEAGPIRQGQWLGLGTDRPPVIRNTAVAAAQALLEALVEAGAGRVTVLTGNGADPADTAVLVGWLEGTWPQIAVEVHDGGQPFTRYLLGVEPG